MKKLNILNDSVKFEEEDFRNIKEVLEKSQLSIFNSEVILEFETMFLQFLSENRDENRVTSLPNCTSAIFIALQLLNLKVGDEIIVPNLTHSSSIYPILYSYGVKIKVCDFSKTSYELDIEHLKRLISEKTKAVVLCYLHGYPTNTDEVLKICKDKNIKLIEDSAQGLGVKIDKEKAGNIGDYSCFSFGENKLLRMGEGGALRYNEVKDS
ncbi:MAG: aminotransferase class I/II-fold pyridoxal phosphate-dependent enzyme, partial [Fusobacteriaceae bacterium]